MTDIQSDTPTGTQIETQIEIHLGDNLEVIRGLPSEQFDLIYIDPPFNTGRRQRRTQLRTELADDGDRIGWSEKRYKTTRLASRWFADAFGGDYTPFSSRVSRKRTACSRRRAASSSISTIERCTTRRSFSTAFSAAPRS